MDKTIIAYIEQELLSEELEDGLEISDDLLGSAILDSMGMIKLITFLEGEFKIQVLPEEMIIENFMTVGHICTFLTSKQVIC